MDRQEVLNWKHQKGFAAGSLQEVIGVRRGNSGTRRHASTIIPSRVFCFKDKARDVLTGGKPNLCF